eukprot:Colp12_sorted_trinity150504_noHs@27906
MSYQVGGMAGAPYNQSFTSPTGRGAGGFIPGAFGSPTTESPAPGKRGGTQSLTPVTIRQLLSASKDNPDDSFKVDGREIAQVTFVGIIRKVAEQTTNLTYLIEDGTGGIDVKLWIDSDDSEAQAQKRAEWQEGVYVRVTGPLKSFSNSRNVVAFNITPIRDFNEITYHMLESMHVHLEHTRGPINAPTKPRKLEGDFNDVSMGGTNNYASNSSGFTPVQQAVFDAYKELDREPSGPHMDEIIEKLRNRSTTAAIKDAIEWLSTEGHIYSTIDDHHYRCT